MNTKPENPDSNSPGENTSKTEFEAMYPGIEPISLDGDGALAAAQGDRGDESITSSAEQQEAAEPTKPEDAPAALAEDSGEYSVESLKSQLVDAEKRVLIAHADLENFRRRNRRDMQDQLKYASLKLMGDVLESVDNLYRAIESFENDANGDGLVEGVKMVAQQISSTLEGHGCKKIDAVGQTFDPNKHQALQMQPSEEFGSNVVMTDLRAGFELHDRVIRPSQVFVSTGPADNAKE